MKRSTLRRPPFGKPSLGTVLGGLALFVAGSGTAAAAGSLVTISDGATSATAKVATDGKLHVGDGSGPLDVAGTVTTRLATPANLFRGFSESFGSSCLTVYTPPSGKAAILTDVTTTSYSGGRSPVSWRLFVGPTSSPCGFPGFLGLLSTVDTQVLAYAAGITIPAGSSLFLNQFVGDGGASARGVISVAGHLVPANTVPAPAPAPAANAKDATPTGTPGGATTGG